MNATEQQAIEQAISLLQGLLPANDIVVVPAIVTPSGAAPTLKKPNPLYGPKAIESTGYVRYICEGYLHPVLANVLEVAAWLVNIKFPVDDNRTDPMLTVCQACPGPDGTPPSLTHGQGGYSVDLCYYVLNGDNYTQATAGADLKFTNIWNDGILNAHFDAGRNAYFLKAVKALLPTSISGIVAKEIRQAVGINESWLMGDNSLHEGSLLHHTHCHLGLVPPIKVNEDLVGKSIEEVAGYIDKI